MPRRCDARTPSTTSRLAAETELLLRGATQSAALDRLEAERDDLRAGYRHLIAVGEVDVVADVVWRLFLTGGSGACCRR